MQIITGLKNPNIVITVHLKVVDNPEHMEQKQDLHKELTRLKTSKALAKTLNSTKFNIFESEQEK